MKGLVGTTMLIAGLWTGSVQAQPAVTAPAAAAPTGIGGWRVNEEVRQLDNTRVYRAVLDSTNRMPNSIGRLEPATLIVRCSSGTFEIYIAWPGFIGTRSIPPVRYKFGEGEIKTEYWSPSDGGTGTFVRDTGAFANNLAANSRLVVQAQPYRGGVQEAVFDLSGSAQAVTGAISACRR